MSGFPRLSRVIRFLSTRSQNFAAIIRPQFIFGLNAGAGVRIAGSTRIRVTDGGKLFLGERGQIERFSEITAMGGTIQIGSESFIGQGSVIVSRSSIHIGKDALIAENVTIRDQNHNYGRGLRTRSAGFHSAPIVIGDNVWLGAKVTVLAGVTIGDGCIVGAGSVVTRDLPPYCVAAGAPARVIKAL